MLRLHQPQQVGKIVIPNVLRYSPYRIIDNEDFIKTTTTATTIETSTTSLVAADRKSPFRFLNCFSISLCKVVLDCRNPLLDLSNLYSLNKDVDYWGSLDE